MCIGSAFSPLMYHASCAAGIELWETHVTLTLSPILYLGWPPIISGPWSGKSITSKYVSIDYVLRATKWLLSEME